MATTNETTTLTGMSSSSSTTTTTITATADAATDSQSSTETERLGFNIKTTGSINDKTKSKNDHQHNEMSGGNNTRGGFRMQIHASTHLRKRKRRTVPSEAKTTTTRGHSSSKEIIVPSPGARLAPFSNVLEDDDDDDDDDDETEEQQRRGKLISMSLSASSSSSSSSSSGDDDDEDEDRDDDVEEDPDAAGAAEDSCSSSVVTARTSNLSNNNNNNNNNNRSTRKQPLEETETTPVRGTKSHVTSNNGHDDYTQNVQHSNTKNSPATNTVVVSDGKALTHGEEETLSRQEQQQQQQQQQQQPEGWRVKLYRLNADGSWDDCGTGRIMCLYKAQRTKSNASNDNSLTTTTEVNSNNGSGNTNEAGNANGSSTCSNYTINNGSSSSGDAWVYQELGEPTLCMHSEITSSPAALHQPRHSNANNHLNTSPPSSSRILLRTRILLRDAYQRQGGNIITWCEPYLEVGNPAQGVDLALSFQDNAGCLDIWRQITHVQSRANEMFLSQRSATDTSSNNNGIDGSNSSHSGNTTGMGRNNTGDHGGTSPVGGIAHAVAAAHHAGFQRQDQPEMWVNVASDGAPHQGHHSQQQHHAHHHGSSHHHLQGPSNNNNGINGNENDHFEDAVGGVIASYHETSSTGGASSCMNASNSPHLPNPPTLANLEEIADTIAAVQHMQQRESLAMYISQNDCSYLKSLLSLFPSAEARGDYGSLATLAACVKTILLLNDPSIIELIVTDELSFEEVCSTLEYDPDLRDKANHRWFLRERAKFRTVALMEDEELIAAIHRSFRVNYLRDTLLRPTMDESSLSTLSSLQTFTHADVVKGVTMSPAGTDDQGELLRDSYLAKIIRILGREQDAICLVEWRDLESLPSGGDIRTVLAKRQEESNSDLSTVVSSGKYPQSQKMSTIWKQHLAPQDNSMSSRRLRRRGSLSFLRELFNMVRISLQQTDKDDFFAVLVSMEVDLTYDQENYTPDGSPSATSRNRKGNESKEKESPKLDGTSSSAMEHSPISSEPVNLLSLLANVLSDPETDVTEKASVLEIVAGIAMHDPSLIRRRCLDFYSSWKRDRKVGNSYQEQAGPTRPNPNEKKQVIFLCPPNDLLASLLFLLATESDAGVLLQASEIMRIILDTDMMGDHAMNTGFADEAEGIPPNGGHKPLHDQHPNPTGTGNTTSTEQNQFLSMFYENYIQWLAAPFQYTILYPLLRIPRSVLVSEKRSHLIDTMLEKFKKGAYQEETLLFKVHFSALRNSFAVELLSFCVRAHQYRMKFFLLRSRVLGNVLKLLKPSSLPRNTSGDRCLKLAVLRFLRAILSVNDEFYHRHIIQHDLFGPVFEAFRANPVGDNLVSSSIVEMCDYINTENIISLMEYIVTKYLSATGAETPLPSLEDVSSPYVSTLTYLRQTYEKLLHERSSKAHTQLADQKSEANSESGCEGHSRYFHDGAMGRSRIVMNEKALEDQRKYREVDQEESYFEADDDENGSDEIEAQEVIDNELHRTPRMFSLAHTPLLSNTYLGLDENKLSDNNSNV